MTLSSNTQLHADPSDLVVDVVHDTENVAPYVTITIGGYPARAVVFLPLEGCADRLRDLADKIDGTSRTPW